MKTIKQTVVYSLYTIVLLGSTTVMILALSVSVEKLLMLLI